MVQQVHPDIESLEAANPSSLDPQEDLGPWLLLLPVVGDRNPAVRDRRIQGLGFEVQHFWISGLGSWGLQSGLE